MFINTLTGLDSHFIFFKNCLRIVFFPLQTTDSWFLCMQVTILFLGKHEGMCKCFNLHGVLSTDASVGICAKCWFNLLSHTDMHTYIHLLCDYILWWRCITIHSLSSFLLSFSYASSHDIQSPKCFFSRQAFDTQKLLFLIITRYKKDGAIYDKSK